MNMLRSLFITVTLLAASFQLAAADSVIVTNRNTGQNTYEIVFESNKSTLDLKPGIYSINKKGESVPVVLGSVLGVNRGFNGLLFQSSLASNENGADSIAVINGRLVLFNSNNSVKGGKTKKPLFLGEQGFQLLDPQLGIPFSAQINITSIEDFSIRSFGEVNPREGLPNGGELVIASIKQPNSFGSGLTFSFYLETGSSSASTPKIVGGTAPILAYDYFNEKQLAVFFTGNRFQLVSNTLLKAITQIYSSEADDKLISRWLKAIGQFVKSIESNRLEKAEARYEFLSAAIPKFEPLTGKSDYSYYPARPLGKNLPLYQVFNVSENKWYVMEPSVQTLKNVTPGLKTIVGDLEFVSANEFEGNSKVIPGKVNVDPSGAFKIIDLDPSEKEVQKKEYLISVGASAVFLFRDKNNALATLEVAELDISTLKKLEAVHYRKGADGGLIRHNVYLSALWKNGSKRVFALSFLESEKGFQIDSLKEIADQFITRDELRDRSTEMTKGDHQGLFIDLTLPIKGAAAYRKSIAKMTTSVKPNPYFFSSLNPSDTDGQSAYLRANNYIAGTKNASISFLQFGHNNVEQANTEATGFYVDFAKTHGAVHQDTFELNLPLFYQQNNPNFIPGKPLHRDKLRGSELALDVVSLGKASDYYLSAIPFQSSIRHNAQKKFSLLFALSDNGNISGTATPDTKTSVVNVDVDYESLVGLEIFLGKRSFSNHFSAVLMFGKNSQSQTQGVLAISGYAHKGNEGGAETLRLEVRDQAWLHKGQINPAEISERIKADTRGSLYWIDTLDVDKESSNYRVKRLFQPSQSFLYVNRELEKGEAIQLRYDEELNDGNKKSSLYSKWNVTGPFSLESKVDAYKKYLTSLRDRKKKENDQKEKAKNLSYDDYDYSYIQPGGFGGMDGWKKLHKASSPYLIQFLEDLADPSRSPDDNRRQILLVEDRMRDVFLNDIMFHLAEDGDRFTVEMEAKSPFEFFYYDIASTLEENVKELNNIRERAQGRPTLLFVDLKEVNKAVELQSEALAQEKPVSTNSEEGSEENKQPKIQNPLSRWLLLASDGKSFDLKKIRKRIQADLGTEIPMLIYGTPQEYETAIESNQEAYKLGVFENFEINNQFLTGTWKQWTPKSKNASDAINDYATTPVAEEEYRVFPILEEIFARAAEGELQGKQVVLKVSAELKPLINRLIMAQWATLSGNSKNNPWHHSNEKLSFYQLQGDRTENSQARVFENFQAMRGNADFSNVVFYSDLERIQQIGRPFNESGRTFRLKDPVGQMSVGVFDSKESNSDSVNEEAARLTSELEQVRSEIETNKGSLDSGNYQEGSTEYAKIHGYIKAQQIRESEIVTALGAVNQESGKTTNLPHLMWLIASEGERIQPKTKKGWSLENAVDRRYATVLIGTHEEWDMVEQDITFEANYLDVNEHFDVLELNAPSEQVKYELVRSLIEKPEIQSLGYDFVIPNFSNEDAQRQLIHHFVNRVEQIASQKGIEETAAFIRAFSELRTTLIEDTALRRSRVIDKNFMERLFFKIFPLPISLENLEKDDPLNRLKNIPEAARNLQRQGYHGPMELKERTLDTILSQTRGSDGGRPIPNSQILFGGTSSGKTFLFKTIVAELGLVEYDANKASNEEADYLIISVQNIVENDKNETGKLTIDQVIEQIDDLLAQPKGNRAFILFDDAHKTASPAIHQKLFSKIQSLFEAPGGMIRVKRRNSNEFKEVPVQNLNLYMTVNPTANKVQKNKYADGNDLNKLVLAALATHNVDMEDSVLARWSDIIDLDKFPRGAKVPALVERIRASSSASNNTVLVSSDAIDKLVEAFPDANSREFLNPAAAALTNIPPSARDTSLYIVTKREGVDFGTLNGGRRGFLVSADLNKAVKEMTQVDAITFDQPLSIMKLVHFLMGNFRMQVFNNMVLATQNTDVLRLNAAGQSTIIQKNFILSVMTHLLKHPTVPLGELPIRGNEYSYLTDIEVEEIVNHMAKLKANKTEYFPFEIGVTNRFSPFDAEGFLANRPLLESHVRSRQDVFAEAVSDIESIFNRMLKLYTRFDNGNLSQVSHWQRADIENWFQSLERKEPLEEYKKLSEELVKTYRKFVDDLYDGNLVEAKEGFAENFSIYDHGRLFSYLVDKAIVQLPWGLLSKFVVDVIGESSDLSLGQKPSFIDFAYHQSISPLSIVTSDFLNETFADQIKDKKVVESLDRGFRNRCDMSLSNKAKKGGNE